MPQSLADLHIHLIFSTKRRENMIAAEIEKELFAYFGGIVNNSESKLVAAGGTENHVHLLISLSKNVAVSRLVGDIKRNSSKWIKTKDRQFAQFEWQNGYAAFSVGYTQIEIVKSYIARQKEHHRVKIYEDEMRQFLDKYNVNYDERYLWD